MTAICLLAVVLAFVALSFERAGDSREEQVVWDLEPVQLKTGAAPPETGIRVHLERLPATADLEGMQRAA